ncbi:MULTISPECIES: putative DNA-binding protein [Paraliobacillus]|uniref:putative DNA-binding protein n=1 Tax=Paraliobacillus TaxID=200903 RepID=UPI0018E4ED26|nr:MULTISPECIES: putative DNA-binding protein [Paraliobacillus]
MLEKTTRVNFLFDFYQALLTPKQRNYMEMYYLEDYSLGEISETYTISRQAVYDNIRRTEAMLEAYEEKLELYDKFISRQKLLNELQEIPEIDTHVQAKKIVNDLKELD